MQEKFTYLPQVLPAEGGEVVSHTFKDGTPVKAVQWESGEVMEADGDTVESMEISMESGHMAMIPFVRVNFRDGSVGMVSANLVWVLLKEAKDG